MLYVDRPLLATLPSDCNADRYNQLLLRDHGPFWILQVAEHALTVDKIGIANVISIDCTTPAVETIEHSHRFKVSKTSLEEKQTYL